MTTATPIYKSSKEGKVRLTMTLDPRKGTDREMSVCVRVRVGNIQRYFLVPDERYTTDEFVSIINEDNRKQGKKRKEFDDFFDKIRIEAKDLIENGEYSPADFMEMLTTKLNGIKKEEEAQGMTIYDVWELVLKELSDANRIGTRNSYRDAFNRFKTDMGEKVSNTSINQNLVDRWIAKMQNPKEGKPKSQSTIGIYLRAFRVVVRRAASMGVLLADKMDLFKGVKDVNRKGDRKEWCLNVEKMTMLYEFFKKGEALDQEGKEKFAPQYKERVFRSLGLFLFSYLANGANLADIAKLRYDEFYYNHEQKAMRFIRQKTMRETDGMEVIFPILPQMQVILDRFAYKPQRGSLVFDIIKEGMNEERIKDIVSCENSNVADRMEVVMEILGMEEKPSPTWCRHSYATNLRDAGVPTEYISTMMGHTMTSGSTTTLNYLARYSMATMIAYNSKLLKNDNGDAEKKEEIMEKLMSMDADKLAAIVKLLE